MNTLKMFGVSFFTFFVLDLIWLVLIAKNLYNKYLGYIMTDKVIWPAAILFYILFIAGLIFFVISPALSRNQWYYALYAGAIYGLITYATYDLTNLATLKDWPLLITVVDLIWGTTVSMTTSTLSFFILRAMDR